jgi:hypothetical protein
VLLVAGFLDAFAARQRRFPAVSAVGTNLPDHLLPDLDGRTVAVAFDVGEEAAAARVVAKLDAARIPAFSVHLSKLGLPEGGDLAAYFAHSGSPRRLQRLINREGGWAQ